MRKILISIILAISLLMNSCEGVLDVPNENAYDAETFFTTEASCLESCNATYSALLLAGGYGGTFFRIYNLLGYDAKKNFPLGAAWAAHGDYSFNPSSERIASIFGMFYKVVFRANFTLDVIENMELTDPDEIALVTRYSGEAEFLKAFAYYNLVASFGALPLKTSLADHYIMQQERTSASEIWAHVETTLLNAIEKLPVGYDEADYGRATKGAAVALLGKVYLTQGKYSEAIAQLSKLTSAPYDYELAGSLDDMFVWDLKTKETIFAIMHATWQGYGLGDPRNSSNGNETNPGKVTATARQRDYSFLEWWNTMVSGPVIEACNYNDEEGNPYHDPRAALIFYDSFDKNGNWLGGDTTFCDHCPGGPKSYPDYKAIGRKSEKYSWRKLQITEFSDVNNGVPAGDINDQILRYADVLLMLAESYIEQPVPDLSTARDLINQVRARSGAFEYSSLGTQSEARSKLRRERTIEFPGELIRWYDMVRWGVLVEQLNAEKMKYEGISPLKPWHILLPIPQSERDANALLDAQVTNDWN